MESVKILAGENGGQDPNGERKTGERKKRTNNRKGEWNKVNKKNDEKKSGKGWGKKKRREREKEVKKNKWNRACVGTLS